MNPLARIPGLITLVFTGGAADLDRRELWPMNQAPKPLVHCLVEVCRCSCNRSLQTFDIFAFAASYLFQVCRLCTTICEQLNTTAMVEKLKSVATARMAQYGD